MKHLILLLLLCLPILHVNAAACPVNCDECTDSPQQCLSCPQQYTLSSDASRCVKCPSACIDCATFNGRVVCIECQEGYTTNPSNGLCRSCPANCAHCHFDFAYDGYRCDVCDANYVLNNDGSRCDALKQEYVDVLTGERKSCPPETIECIDNGLDFVSIKECRGHIYQNQERTDPTKYICVNPCGSGKDCDVNPKVKCLDGYRHTKDPLYELCRSCREGFYDEVEKRAYYYDEGRCQACPNYATRCRFENKIYRYVTCKTGYKVYQGECFLCPANCQQCGNDRVPTKRLMECNICKEGYYKSEKECLKCECATCEGQAHHCLSSTCLQNCTACDGYQCTQCAPGTALKCRVDYLAPCANCDPGCSKCHYNCSPLVEMVCDACQQGYSRDPNDPNVCQPCPRYCLTCKEKNTCSECISGYTLIGKECKNCLLHFQNCATCDSTTCFSCDDGYVLKNNVMSPYPECRPSAVRSKDHCAGHPITDPPPRCHLERCVNGSSITATYQCAIMCYHCSKNVSCKEPKITACVTGQCYTQKENSSVVAAGCKDETIYDNNIECCQTNFCNDVYSGNANVRLNGCLLLFTVLIGFISFI